MRRPDSLEWLLIAAMLLSVAALGQSIFVSANANLVHTVSAAVTASREAAAPAAPDTDGGDPEGDGGAATAYAAIDGMSLAIAAESAAHLDRGAKWLALTSAALMLLLVTAIVVRARQISRARSVLPPATER